MGNVLTDSLAKYPTVDNVILNGLDFLSLNIPKPLSVAGPITKPSIVMLHGGTGVGKTIVADDMVLSFATGKDWLAYGNDRTWKTLIVDGEMYAGETQERFLAQFQGHEDALDENVFVLHHDVWEQFVPDERINFDLIDHQSIFQGYLDDLREQNRAIDVIVFDNLSSLVWGIDGNRAEAWDNFLLFCLRLKSDGYTVIVVVHEGKDPSRGMRGSSRLLEYANLGIKLSASLADMEQGKFRLSFDKSRGKFPQSLDCRIAETDGRISVEYADVAGESSEAWLKTLHYLAENPTATQTDIGKHFGVKQGAVSKHFKKARDKGYLDYSNAFTELGRKVCISAE